MTITEEDYKALRRPFTADAVKFRIDGRPTAGYVRVLTYLDSRLVAERLSEVDPNWEGHPDFVGHGYEAGGIGLDVGAPVAYELKVLGVRRTDVGQIGPAAWDDNNGLFKKGDFVADDKHAKVAVSDALKRSAVLFGVGSYLYTTGNIFLDVKKYTDKGEGKYINAEGLKYLKKQYNDFISQPAFVDRFGTPVSYGEELANPDVAVKEEAKEKPAVEKTEPEVKKEDSDNRYAEVVAGIYENVGRDPDAGRLWVDGRKNKKLAVKKTLQQAVAKGVKTEVLDSLLVDNALEELVGAY